MVSTSKGQGLVDSIKRQAEDLRKKQMELSKLEQRLKKQERALESKLKEVEKRDAAIKEAEERLNREKEELEESRKKLQKQMDRFQDELDTLENRSAELDFKETTISDMEKNLAQREVDIEQKQKELVAREEKLIDEERDAKERLLGIIEEHENDLVNNKEVMDDLKDKVVMMDRLLSSLEEVRGSVEEFKKGLTSKVEKVIEHQDSLLRKEKDLERHLDEMVTRRESIIRRERELIELQRELRSIVSGGFEEAAEELIPDDVIEEADEHVVEYEDIEEPPETEGEEESVEIEEETPSETAEPAGEAEETTDEGEFVPTGSPLDEVPVDELRDMALEMGLPVTGKKEELIKRIEAFKLDEEDFDFETELEPPKPVTPTADEVKEAIREAQALIAKAYNMGVDISRLKPLLKSAKELSRSEEYIDAMDMAQECRLMTEKALENLRRP